jgi:predicted GNAT superfamily acetyltransferase
VAWSLADIAKAPATDDIVETLEIPADIEALRVSDPAAAHEWRTRLRAEMAEILGRGLRIAGFDVERGYLFTQ